MKRKMLFFILPVLCLIFALPAHAIHYDAVISADCDGFEINITGVSWIVYTAAYTFNITDSQGGQSTVTGSFDIDPGDNYPDITYSGVWDNELCGIISISGVVELTTDAVPPTNPSSPYYNGYPSFTFPYESPEIDCECEESPGTGTPGYWKNHPKAWPVPNIIIGGINYTKEEAIALMDNPVSGDKTYTMFPALVSAILNVLIGNGSSCIDDTIEEADLWMAENPVGSVVAASSEEWKAGEPLYLMLDDYNNGLLCVPSRDSMEEDEEEDEEEDVPKKALAKPAGFTLQQNNPNPFNPITTISFSLPYSSNVTLKVYSMLGEQIATLTDGTFSAGVHSVEWNASEFSSGIYFYRIETGSFVDTKKLLLLK